MIKTEKLTKVFTTEEVETLALNDVDVHVNKGEFVKDVINIIDDAQ